MHQRDYLDMSPITNNTLKSLFSPNAASSKAAVGAKRKHNTAFKQNKSHILAHDDQNFDMMANQMHTYTPVHHVARGM